MSEETFQTGEWVKVWAQVAECEKGPHPEDLLVEFFSHNEQFEAPIKRDRVLKTKEIPEFAERCPHLNGGGHNEPYKGMFWKCALYLGHPGLHTANSGSLKWTDKESGGFFEEK